MKKWWRELDPADQSVLVVIGLTAALTILFWLIMDVLDYNHHAWRSM